MKKILAVAVLMLVCASAAFAAEAVKNPLSYYIGAGYAKELESGAPGGSIAGQAGVDYMVTPDISVGAMAGFYMLGSTTVTDPLTNYSAKAKTSVIPITASAAYHIASSGSLKPRVEAGAGLYIMHASVDVTDASGNSVSSVLSGSSNTSKFGFNVGAGAEIDNGKSMTYGAEARFHLIPSAGTDSSGNSTSAKMLSIVLTLGFK